MLQRVVREGQHLSDLMLIFGANERDETLTYQVSDGVLDEEGVLLGAEFCGELEVTLWTFDD
jgi:hypothetical protein